MTQAVDGLVEFSELEAHARNSGKPFREGVLDYFRFLGEKLGYTVRENSSVIKYGLTLGHIDIAWIEVKTIFFCEFANLDAILRDAWLAMEFDPDRVVFVLSGKSKASPQAVEKIMSESEMAKPLRDRTVLIDVSAKTVRSLKP